MAGLFSAQISHAQLAGSLSLQSDYLARGYSVTGHRPAATVELSFDDISGIYANGTLTGSFDSANSPAVKGMAANIGYTHALSPGISLDSGYVHSRYFHFAAAPGREDAAFDEYYLGAVFGRIAYHAYYSPDYLNTGIATLYHEVAGSTALTGRLRVHARLGVTSYFEAPGRPHLKNDYRWAIGVSRPAGPMTIDLTLDGGRSNLKRFFHDEHPGETRLAGGIRFSF